MRGGEATRSIAARLLAGVRVVPDWAVGALTRYDRELQEAYKAKDSYRIKNAQRELTRIRSKVGLEGHANVGKRV
jgi:hypothetical protein